jgi:hypothetical protein
MQPWPAAHAAPRPGRRRALAGSARRRTGGGARAAAALALALAACLHGVALVAGAGTPATNGPLDRAPDGRPLQLTFADEFDTFRPWVNGTGVWRTKLGNGTFTDDYSSRNFPGNREVQLYTDPGMRPHTGFHRRRGEAQGSRWQRDAPPLGLNPFEVHDGVLDLVADRAPRALLPKLGGFKYTSGVITTQPSFSQLYGYFEMRAKLPRGKGAWPAFWLIPADSSWPPEIDVLESFGDPGRISITAHTKVKADRKAGTGASITPDEFHVFSVAWDPKQLIWYVDGREIKRQKTPSDFTKPLFMIANVALGGGSAGMPNASTPFPMRMSIDYIRAYRFAQ